jgi:putative hydrolase
MKLIRDYHVHSKYSKNGHCKNEIELIVQKGIEKGLKEIAISDHGLQHFLYGTNEIHLKEAREEIDRLQPKYPEITIKLGIEANLIGFDGETDITEKVVELCDVIQMGIHFGVWFRPMQDAFKFFILNFLGRWFKPLRDHMIAKNTQAMIRAMERYPIDIITHPGDKIPVDVAMLAQKAEETRTLLEINNGHGHLTREEIQAAEPFGVGFIIGSDAHTYDEIGEYKRALERINDAGLDLSRVVNLEG